MKTTCLHCTALIKESYKDDMECPACGSMDLVPLALYYMDRQHAIKKEIKILKDEYSRLQNVIEKLNQQEAPEALKLGGAFRSGSRWNH